MDSGRVICLHSNAFYELLDQVIDRINSVHGLDKADRWVSAEECMRLLNIKSKTTLWELKSQGKLAFSSVTPKIVLYDRFSIMDYLNLNRKEAF